MNTNALLQIMAQHLQVTTVLLEDYLRLVQTSAHVPSQELLDMISISHLLRERVQAIVGQ